MLRLGCIAITAGLLLSPDVPQGSPLQAHPQTQQQIPPNQTVPVLPAFPQLQGQGADGVSVPGASSSGGPGKVKAAQNGDRLTEDSRLLLLRYISGEFVRMSSPLPGGKQGFHLRAGQSVDQDALHQAILKAGAAVYTGDKVQLTKIDFRANAIAVDVNGGGRGHTSWKDHLQMSVGVPTPVQTSTTTTSDDNGPVIQQKTGATLYLDFGEPVPDMTPDQLKSYLGAVLDFSKERSAAVQWTETLPPKVKLAIAEKRAEVGMDRDMVIAALGRPDRKVREQDSEGNDTEDWIYGKPPAPTTFVRFSADKVVQIDKYPQ
jgi:hypothetical protein